MMLLLLLLLPLSCQAAPVSIERSVTSSSFLFDYEPDQTCNYAGEITLSHPMSVGPDDRYYVVCSQMLQAAHISLDAVNQWPRCGVHLNDGNYSLRLRTYGDNSSANMTEAIGNAIVNQTDFMLAGYSSSLTGKLARIAQANQRLLITAGSTRVSVHGDRDHVFGLLPTSGSYLENVFKGLASKGAKSVAMISEDDVNACLDTEEWATQHNMAFLNGTFVPVSTPYDTYLEVAQTFAQLNPDVVITCVRNGYGFWNKAVRATLWSPKAQVYTMVAGTPEFEEALGADTAYVMGVSSWDRALPPVPDGATGWTPYEFDAAFEKANFRRPVYQHVSQSAALSVLVQALERVGNYHDTPAIRDELATGYFPTVYGNISFDDNGQNTAPSLLMQYDHNGTVHVLLPSSLRSTEFEMIYPMPSYGYRDCETFSDCASTNGTCAADGTCDCQYYEAVSEGKGSSAKCVIPPSSTNNYLGLAIGFPIVALFVVGVATYVYMKKVNRHDDSVWQIAKKDLIFDDPPDVVGRGSFGVVILAEYRGTQVAVKKVLPPNQWKKMDGSDRTSDDSNSPVGLRKASIGNKSMESFYTTKGASASKQLTHDFIEEMRTLNKLRHPTIITVLGAVVDPTEEPMLVMEYMQHGSLYSMLHNETMLLDDDILLPILKDISSGCRYLHAAEPQVIHGDLKAQNILVDDKFRAKVADFGLAAIRTKDGATGTPYWMAPELLRCETLNTAASDVYSFGMILYEVCSRREPYDGQDPSKTLAQIADPKINLRPQAPKDCPPQLASLMADCLVADPEERPSFEEVDTRLKRVEARTDNKSTTVSLFDIFPRHVAEALRDGKKVEPEHKDSVTIFFSDIIDYTSIASELDPRKVAAMLDRLYSKLDALSLKHDVFKVETIGDAYMAVTNLVKDQAEDHALRIAEFAIDAIKAAKETLIDPEDPDKGHLNIRCGFHSGAVVADVVGSRNPRYCLFGDTVNTAARMESNSDKNRILCSCESADLLQKQNFDLGITRRGKIEVKGKGNLLVYWVGEGETNEVPPECAMELSVRYV